MKKGSFGRSGKGGMKKIGKGKSSGLVATPSNTASLAGKAKGK